MLDLCEELAELLRSSLSTLKLKTKSGETRAPHVVVGWLPIKRAGETEDDEFPFVRILPIEGYDSMTEDVCTVSVVIGAWADDPGGWKDAINAFQRCRIAIDTMPYMQLKTACLAEIKGKVIDWKLYDEQPYPQWFADMRVNFNIRKPDPTAPVNNDVRAGQYPAEGE